MTGVA